MSWELEPAQPVTGGSTREIRLHSQIWRGISWTHRLLLIEPENLGVNDVVLLYVTGNPSFGEDFLGLALARMAGLRLAILNSVPNQPLFGLREDALIAYTFERYLAEGSPEWPLLYPMTQSVIAAMDALSALAPKLWGASLRGFIVAGASKRGWTTYLAAAADPKRILGIIPIVYDFLNIPLQLARQEELLGGPSLKLLDYTLRGLTTLGSPAAMRLAWLVDPFTYRHAYTMPKLVIVGSNDPYWATDATSLYWPALPDPKILFVVPNTGHNVLFGDRIFSVVAAFVRAVAKEKTLPQVQSYLRFRPDRVELEVTANQKAVAAKIWLAESAIPDLDRARWREEELLGDGLRFQAKLKRSTPYLGVFAELTFQIEGLLFVASTPIRIIGP